MDDARRKLLFLFLTTYGGLYNRGAMFANGRGFTSYAFDDAFRAFAQEHQLPTDDLPRSIKALFADTTGVPSGIGTPTLADITLLSERGIRPASEQLEVTEEDDGGWTEWEKSDGINHGTYREFFPNRRIRCVQQWHHGREHGQHISYNADGSPDMESNWLDGVSHGPYRTWHPNGKLKWERNWHHGLEHGANIRYFEDGTIEDESFWRFGERDGEWNTYDQTGAKKTQGVWVRGILKRELERDVWNDLWRAHILPLYTADEELTLDAVATAIAATALPCYSISITATASNSITDSVFGDAHFLPTGVAWPSYNGTPLSPLFQIRTSDLPNPPPALSGCDYIVAFAAQEMEEFQEGKDIVFHLLRPGSYEVAPRPEPLSLLMEPRRALVEAEHTESIDVHDVPKRYLSGDSLENHPAIRDLRPRSDTKIGGWPTFIQTESVRSLPNLIFQVDSRDFDDWKCGDGTKFYVLGYDSIEVCFADMS